MNCPDAQDKTNQSCDPASVFDAEDYLYFYGDMIKDEYTDEEVAFLIQKLCLESNKKILDLACGHGRHANRLAEFGHDVTGIDQSQEFLSIGRDDADKRGVRVKYLCFDSRKYCEPEAYDCVIHLFSSFGYFSDEENELVIRNIASSLRPGGMVCLDILNRDVFLKDYPRFAVREKNSDLMIDRNRFDTVTGRLYNSRIIMRDGKRRDTPFFLRLYNPNEIIRIFKNEGLVVVNIYSDWKGKLLDSESKRMILIAKKG
ncbi:class I SAM-dependent methyltransferase [Methanospirillum lacunae]|uniref:Class I SAM-dependent methyltransferase n=1 Tax=Methanospirillum lacunae TaxID=668570 RepID=A0A2V2MYD2_9EURY|nr:class I SAM-dependent methyltransferase [Methanospirillum lacunae]PWR71280.1 class I SAM-dependent methyltransferase [Methanospirillum lacunae]